MSAKMKKNIKYLPWIIWGVAAVFYFLEFFLSVSTNVMKNDLMSAFHIDGLRFGFLASSAYFITYSLMQVPGGLILDMYGPRRVLIASALFCSLGCLFFAVSQTFPQAVMARKFTIPF